MFWILAIAWGVLYVTTVTVMLVFFAGAARANEHWDQDNDALWRAHVDSIREETAA